MALPKLYILPNNKEHDRLQALLAVNPTRPTKAKPNKQQAIWWTIYGLNRAIRAYEGTVYDHIADLSYDTWITPIARWTQANQDWADENNLSAEDLLDRMDGNWAESVGGHRDPFQAAIEAYQADPEAYAPDMLRSTNQRRAATFCVCLQNARQGAGAFFLSQYDLGRVMGVSPIQARAYLQKLFRVGMLQIVKVGDSKPLGGKATEWRLSGDLLQYSSSPVPQFPSATRISGEIRAAAGLSPVPSCDDRDREDDREDDHDRVRSYEVEMLMNLGRTTQNARDHTRQHGRIYDHTTQRR